MKTISSYNLIINLILIISLFIGLFYGEDSGGGGSVLDFKTTWILIEKPFEFESLKSDFKFPLHYYIGALIYFITKDIFLYKLFYVVITCFFPLIFYKTLKIKFPNIDINNLFLFSLVLLLLPHVRTAAIWPNTQITALFFFLITLYNFVKLDCSNNFSKINKNLLFTLFFLALTVYSRQIYALIYLYLVFYFFKKYSLTNFIKICCIIGILAIPGILNILIYPSILSVSFNHNLQNSILINLSIFSFYLIPLVTNFFFLKIYNFKFDMKIFILSFISFLIIVIMVQFFNYNIKLGGGFFMKLSLLFFSNLYLFYFTSFIGIIMIYLFCNKKTDNFVLTLLIILGIASINVQQKYFEPMLILLFFLVYENKYIEKLLQNYKAVLFIFFYYFIYFLLAIINIVFKIKENLMLNL